MQKAKLVELIRVIDGEEQALFGNLPEAERSRRGEPHQWAPKDVLAHLAAWKERLADNLEAAAQGRPETRDDDYEHINMKDFELYRYVSWAEIRRKAAEANRRLGEQVGRLDETALEELRDGRRPQWQAILGTAYMHPVSHLGQVYADGGRRTAPPDFRRKPPRS